MVSMLLVCGTLISSSTASPNHSLMIRASTRLRSEHNQPLGAINGYSDGGRLISRNCGFLLTLKGSQEAHQRAAVPFGYQPVPQSVSSPYGPDDAQRMLVA